MKVHIQTPDVEDFDSEVSHALASFSCDRTCQERQTVDTFLTIKYFAVARSDQGCIGTSMSREEDPFRGNARWSRKRGGLMNFTLKMDFPMTLSYLVRSCAFRSQAELERQHSHRQGWMMSPPRPYLNSKAWCLWWDACITVIMCGLWLRLKPRRKNLITLSLNTHHKVIVTWRMKSVAERAHEASLTFYRLISRNG